MSIVDLAKARAHAASLRIGSSEHELSADWISELADEVESLQAALELARRQHGEMKQLARRRIAERDAAMAALKEIYDLVVMALTNLNERTPE